MKKFLWANTGALLLLLFFLLILPLLLNLLSRVQTLLGRAIWQPANITVDVMSLQGPLNPAWKALAQGGEEDEKMLSAVITDIKSLEPKYIRIDHVLDKFGLVSGGKGSPLTFNFTRLDLLVDDLLQTGATPLISLSYMPSSISRDGQITSPPQNWQDWETVVQTVIEHYSGKSNKNLTGVYYEVWNEPDLFGGWTTNKDPNYLELYRYAASGAGKALNTNPFFFGGPATTGFYPNWLKALLQSGYRVDFISWHRYSENPLDYETDMNALKQILLSNVKYLTLKRLITEWGPNSENSSDNDSLLAAAHLVATTAKIYKWVDFAFTFEIKDGPDPNGQKFWGRWGLLTHEKLGVSKKPRYQALALLNKMSGERLDLTGEGTFISGFAAKDKGVIRLILVNFDKEKNHSETFPVRFTNLDQPIYTLVQTDLDGNTLTSKETPDKGVLEKTFSLLPNSIILLELQP